MFYTSILVCRMPLSLDLLNYAVFCLKLSIEMKRSLSVQLKFGGHGQSYY